MGIVSKHQNWADTFKAYQTTRKPDGDALQDLSLHNYYVMRDHVANEDFLLQKKLKQNYEKHPDKWIPLYSQVTLVISHIQKQLRKAKNKI